MGRSSRTAEATAELEARGVPVADVRDTANAVRDPRLLAAARPSDLAPQAWAGRGLYGSGLPVRFSAASAGYDAPSPWLGEHNDFVLGCLLGYPRERIAALRDAGAASDLSR